MFFNYIKKVSFLLFIAHYLSSPVFAMMEEANLDEEAGEGKLHSLQKRPNVVTSIIKNVFDNIDHIILASTTIGGACVGNIYKYEVGSLFANMREENPVSVSFRPFTFTGAEMETLQDKKTYAQTFKHILASNYDNAIFEYGLLYDNLSITGGGIAGYALGLGIIKIRQESMKKLSPLWEVAQKYVGSNLINGSKKIKDIGEKLKYQ